MEAIEKALAGERLGKKEAEELFRTDLHLLGYAANSLRKRIKGELVTFVVDTNINYTNICESKCSFCAFYRDSKSSEAYVLSPEEILKKIGRARRLGATQVLLQGGLNSELEIEYYEEICRSVKEKFPEVQRHFFSPSEIQHIARVSGLSVKETLLRLKEAGLQSIPGGGAEILVDSLRKKVSPGKIAWKEWAEVMEVAHSLGIPTTATMVFGLGEGDRERAEHLLRLRRLQERSGGFTAFIPWSFQPGKTALGRKLSYSDLGTGIDYLKVVAASRLILQDSIPNLQCSWITQGKRLAQLALNFGANDFGGTMIEENVVRATGEEVSYLPKEEIVALIKQIDRPAAQRDTLYRILKEY